MTRLGAINALVYGSAQGCRFKLDHTVERVIKVHPDDQLHGEG